MKFYVPSTKALGSKLSLRYHNPCVTHCVTLLPQQNRIQCTVAADQAVIKETRKINYIAVLVMSFDSTKEDFWQTTARRTIRERCQAIFNKELLSDVNFVVRDSQGGSESKTILAHKFVLAIGSPVFHAMFYGGLAETKDSVEISDCDYDSLLEMFHFMYSDEANLNPDNVMQLLYLAKKYMLPSLAEKCSAYLQENLNASNVFHILLNAQKYEEKGLLDHCWKVVEEETDEAVKSDGFVTIERSVLEELVEKDSINIKEVELFKAVDCWAGEECKKKGLVADGAVKRKILGERIVKGIRFPMIEEKDFASVVLDCGMLTQKECFDMMKYFNCVLNTAVGFPETKRGTVSRVKRVSRFKSVAYNEGWPHSSSYWDIIVLSVDRNIKIHKVGLFGSKDNKYLVALKVTQVKDQKIVFEAKKQTYSASQNVQSDIGDYQGFDIACEPPIALKANTKYFFKADIDGPPTWYGQNGQSSVKHSGVTFLFTNYKLNAHTSVEKGQFSEFLFTLD